MLPRQLLAAVLAAAALAPQAQAAQEQGKVRKFQTDTGLTVFLRPVAGATETALVVLYDIGGDHDPKGRSGLAHALEHLYITSAAGEFPAQDYGELVKRHPRGVNSQTGDNYTVHAAVFAPGELERELKEAAARMGDLKITQADLDREWPRIDFELRNMFGRMPQLAAMNLAREKIRPTPLGGRRGGLMQHIRGITVDELKAHWRTYYRQDNAIISVAGAMDAEAAAKWIVDYFAKIPPARKMPPVNEPGKPILGVTEDVLVATGLPKPEPAFACAFRAPPPSSDLYAPFLVTLGRLHSQRAKLEADPKHYPISWTPLDNPEVMYVKLPVPPGATAKDLVARVRKFLDAVSEGDVTVVDKRAAVLTFGRLLGMLDLPDNVLAQDTYGLAFSIGRREQMVIDSVKLGKAVEAVTTKDVERVMREVFAADKGVAILARPQ